MVAWREESTGTSKPNVVENKLSQSAGSKASLALEGWMVRQYPQTFTALICAQGA